MRLEFYVEDRMQLSSTVHRRNTEVTTSAFHTFKRKCLSGIEIAEAMGQYWKICVVLESKMNSNAYVNAPQQRKLPRYKGQPSKRIPKALTKF